jgi:hypothetical protein
MNSPFNSIFSWFIKKRMAQIDLFKEFPIEAQNALFFDLITTAKDTEWGKKYAYSKIESYQDFKQNVPLQEYDELKPFVDRLFEGESNLLWPSEVKWFAKSSGTTSSRSKFIPVTKESLDGCHYKGGKDLLSMYVHNVPDRKLYKGKHLIIGGSAEVNYLNDQTFVGDLSSIIVKNLPWWVELRRTPSREIALMSEWEEKIEKLAHSTINEDVYILAGVPSWSLVLLNRILEITGANSIKEVWPNLELFMHGGVSFDPYKAQFEAIVQDPKMNYIETYNASEGFFGIQDTIDSNEMLLMLDYGIFFEFIPMSNFDGLNSKEVVNIEDVELGKNYAMVISTNAGLWRYIIGDTIKFTSTFPHRIKITGRTKQFINAFGEELIVENAEEAIQTASKKTNAMIKEYTVAPVYMESNQKGTHEWVIEFQQEPESMHVFMIELDDALKCLNSDYDAKRTDDMIMTFPRYHKLSKNSFENWLRGRNKLGGQHKVPRLMNDRKVLEDVLASVKNVQN